MKGSVEAPKACDNFRIGTGALMDTLGSIIPNSIIPLFPIASVVAPVLSTVLKYVSEEIQYQVTQVLQEKVDEDNHKF